MSAVERAEASRSREYTLDTARYAFPSNVTVAFLSRKKFLEHVVVFDVFVLVLTLPAYSLFFHKLFDKCETYQINILIAKCCVFSLITILFSNLTTSINFQLFLFPKCEYIIVARISFAGENINYQYIRNYYLDDNNLISL